MKETALEQVTRERDELLEAAKKIMYWYCRTPVSQEGWERNDEAFMAVGQALENCGYNWHKGPPVVQWGHVGITLVV